MGGRLGRGDADFGGGAPTFLVLALRDPDGANLDRVQIVKGWLDQAGELHEKVFNVAVSAERRVRRSGQVKAVGSTVEAADATYTNSIGAAELAAVWTDPSFDADQRSFYYVRVLEIPTPRWTTYDAAYFDIELAPEAPPETQERAYSSPIWYAP